MGLLNDTASPTVPTFPYKRKTMWGRLVYLCISKLDALDTEAMMITALPGQRSFWGPELDLMKRRH